MNSVKLKREPTGTRKEAGLKTVLGCRWCEKGRVKKG